MMNINLTELTAAELRWLENNVGEARKNAVKAGFQQVANELRIGNLEGMDIYQIAALTGMTALQAANVDNREKARDAGLNKSWKTITKHYICEEDGSRITVTKEIAYFSLTRR